jgi:hypothetical protein
MAARYHPRYYPPAFVATTIHETCEFCVCLTAGECANANGEMKRKVSSKSDANGERDVSTMCHF